MTLKTLDTIFGVVVLGPWFLWFGYIGVTDRLAEIRRNRRMRK